MPLIFIEFLLDTGPQEKRFGMITREPRRCDQGGKYLLKTYFIVERNQRVAVGG